jgi:hypothetical protein
MVNLNPSLISNPSYRTYVSEKEKDVKQKAFKARSPVPPDGRIFPKYRDGPDVKNSHLYPNGKVSIIIPYQYNKIVNSPLLKNIENDVVYLGSQRYTRTTLPNKMRPYWV